MSALNPPRINTNDPTQQDVSDDDHFSSASEGNSQSDIPITRVERVDDQALHGEVPGTPAYDMRTRDAVPDEIEIVPENQRSRGNTLNAGTRSRATSNLSNNSDSASRPETPGGTPIPKTVVEKVDFKPSHGEVEGTEAKEMRMADATPDEVRKAPASAGQRLEGRDSGKQAVAEPEVDESDEGRQAWFRSMWEGNVRTEQSEEAGDEEDAADDAEYDDGDDDFGDDFDDFAEGGGDDADFGDFDEAEEEPVEEEEDSSSQPPPQPPSALPSAPDLLAGLPPLNLAAYTTQAEITEAITPYINAILPNSKPVESPPTDTDETPSSSFLTDRSLSLWQQLVSPPPMQPPNWTRSRIRRLFLVSLGVPVDLDEILPPSKQKRLVLPSIGLEGPGDHRIDRLKDSEGGGNDSTTSLDSKTGAPKPSSSSRSKRQTTRPGPPPPPDFDMNAASLLAATTVEALSVYSDPELKQHVFTLEVLNSDASKVLEYWLQRKDEGRKEKEALEGVIENLVGFVKGRRKAGGK